MQCTDCAACIIWGHKMHRFMLFRQFQMQHWKARLNESQDEDWEVLLLQLLLLPGKGHNLCQEWLQGLPLLQVFCTLCDCHGICVRHFSNLTECSNVSNLTWMHQHHILVGKSWISRSKCHKAFKRKKNPRRAKWTKAFRKSAGKELAVDPSFEFEKKR